MDRRLPITAHAASNRPAYERLRDLPRLLRLWPEDVRRLTSADQAGLVDQLARMLRSERQRGITRHWSYDLTRHAALLRAWRAERTALLTASGRFRHMAAMPAKPMSGQHAGESYGVVAD